MRLASPKTWTRWFWAGLSIFLAYNAVAAYRTYGRYVFVIDYCEEFGHPGSGKLDCVGGWLGFWLDIGFFWTIGAAVFVVPMVVAYVHAPKRPNIANPF